MTLTFADTRTVRPDDGVVSSSGGPRADQPRRRVFTAEYGPDAEAGGQPGVGVAVTQMRQRQQRLSRPRRLW